MTPGIVAGDALFIAAAICAPRLCDTGPRRDGIGGRPSSAFLYLLSRLNARLKVRWCCCCRALFEMRLN
jgi:hypothetical protein